MEEIFIVSLSGSLIASETIDSEFLKQFRRIVLKQKEKKFVITCCRKKSAREYQKAAKKIAKPKNYELDWIGIHATWINVYLLKTIFGRYAHPNILEDPNKKVVLKKKVLIACGWKPGFSTDHDSVLLAKNFTMSKINLRKFYNARPFKKISWKNLRKIIPKKLTQGMNVPFDPVAVKAAELLGLEVSIMNGKKLKNFENYLKGKNFEGTIIR
ncbi:MAG: UMP kinase [Candidatus Pacearchaeota archaeon]|nr:UMP kinase [Candidatus Pacearchaeota archaeon]